MRIAVTSDIHVDVTSANQQIVKHLVTAVEEIQPDVLVICGDISANLIKFSQTLLAFQKLNSQCHKLLVAGNHDIWVDKKSIITSEQKYSMITDISSECDFHHLGGRPTIIDGIGFCGTIGWYDYSFRQEKYKIALEQYESKRYGNSIWNDVNYAKWGCADIKLARRFEGELQAQIDSIKNQVSQIIVVTHHLPFQESVVYQGNLPWDFFSAFMGSRILGEICVNEPLVTHALFGHTHFKHPPQKVREVTTISSPVGYLFKMSKRKLPEYAKECLTVLEINQDVKRDA
jgi:putative phosphoesterase